MFHITALSDLIKDVQVVLRLLRIRGVFNAVDLLQKVRRALHLRREE